jgi:hypothetical protein
LYTSTANLATFTYTYTLKYPGEPVSPPRTVIGSFYVRSTITLATVQRRIRANFRSCGLPLHHLAITPIAHVIGGGQ